MSLQAAIPLGTASSIVYGISIVVQHSAAHTGTGEEDPHGLIQLLRNPRWLLAIAGDFVGFLLQIAALSTGPVVLVQPLVVLMLPVALITGSFLGGPRPGPGEYLSMAAVLGGLTAFIGMVGRARHPQVPNPWAVGIAVVAILVLGAAFCLAVRGGRASLRGAVYGAVAGACFGTLGVLVNTASHRIVDGRITSLLTHPSGIVTVVGIVVLGTMGITLTQMSFQIGALAATLPANLSTDPVVAVVLGVVLLGENLPHAPGYLAGYAVCLGLILFGTIRLAAPTASSLTH
jgi:drug/metabolite transporter (DMT)-like permease